MNNQDAKPGEVSPLVYVSCTNK